MSTLFDDPPNEARFDGPEPDAQRLTGQILRTWKVMSDHKWRTVKEIAQITRDPENSVQAQLRHLRKLNFGAYLVDRRKRSEKGLYEYRVGMKGEGTPQHQQCESCEVLRGRLGAGIEILMTGGTREEIRAALKGENPFDENEIRCGGQRL